MTPEQENEAFSEFLLDLKLAINDYGAPYVFKHFSQVYPTEASQLGLALAANTVTKKIPILLKKKNP